MGLASQDRRGLALWGVEIVSLSETILASYEVGSREEVVDFATHIALTEAVLGSQGTFIASRTTLIRLRGAELVSVETKIGSCRAYLGSCRAYLGLGRACLGPCGACLASHEAVIGSRET